MTPPPGKHDFVAYAGATFLQLVAWSDDEGVDVDANLYHGAMQVKDTSGVAIVDLTTANGRIAGQPDKKARLLIDAATTRGLAPGVYAYDLLMAAIDNGVVTPILQGTFTVKALVTTLDPTL